MGTPKSYVYGLVVFSNRTFNVFAGKPNDSVPSQVDSSHQYSDEYMTVTITSSSVTITANQDVKVIASYRLGGASGTLNNEIINVSSGNTILSVTQSNDNTFMVAVL